MTNNSYTTNFPLGAYFGADEAIFDVSEPNFIATMGTGPQYYDLFIDYTKPISSWVSSSYYTAQSYALYAKGITPVIDLPMLSTAPGSMTADQYYKAFAAGQYDSVLKGIVKDWEEHGFTSLVFRPGSEMNLPLIFSAGKTAQGQADWVAAFQHIYTVLHAAGTADGVKIQVVWNPDANGAIATTNLYPGDAYVDAIGADVFADAWPRTDTWPTLSHHDWATGQEDTTLAQWLANPSNLEHYWTDPAGTVFSNDASKGTTESLDGLLQFAEAHNKPFAIPETGAGNSTIGDTDVEDDALFPQWLSQQLTTAEAAGLKVAFVDLWDGNDNGNYAFDVPTLDGKTYEAAAWDKYFGAGSAPTANAPTIAGAVADQMTMDLITIHPFAKMSITDATGEIDTITVSTLSPAWPTNTSDPTTPSNPAHGTLSNLDGGTFNATTGVYTVSGTAAAVTAALQGLVFTPAVLPGAVSTDFTVTATNGAGSVSDSATTLTTEHSLLTFSGQTIVGTSLTGPGPLTFTDMAGSNTIIGGVGGLNVTISATKDVISTVGGATDTIALNVTGTTVRSAGTDVITLSKGGQIITTTGKATIIGATGSNAYGLVGNDTLSSLGTDTIRVMGGNSVITASGTATTVNQTAGTAQVTETGGGDYEAETVSGAATITTGAGKGGFAITTSTKGPSTVTLGAGTDTVISQSADTIYAGTGSAVVTENTLGVTFIAGAGSSTVTEAANASSLALASGASSATGANIFTFINGSGGGHDTIYNFRSGIDQLAFTGYTGSAVQSQVISGGALSISLTDSTHITLIGVTRDLQLS